MESQRTDSARCPMCGHINTFQSDELTQRTADRWETIPSLFGTCSQCGERIGMERPSAAGDQPDRTEKTAAIIVLAVIAVMVLYGLISLLW